MQKTGLIFLFMCISPFVASAKTSECQKDNYLDFIFKTDNRVPCDLESADSPITYNLSSAKLRGSNLKKVDWPTVNLSGADLQKTDLTSANLESVNLFKADLSFAKLIETNLMRANLILANLRSANLSRANLTLALLMGANFTNADLTGADLTGANLIDADLRGAKLSGAALIGADFQRAKVDSHLADYLQALESQGGLLFLDCEITLFAQYRGSYYKRDQRPLSVPLYL